MGESTKRYEVVCGFCGKPFTARSTRGKWCSDYCRKQANYSSTCADCGGHVPYSGHAEPSKRCGACEKQRIHREAYERLTGEIRRWHRLFGQPPAAFEWNLAAVAWKQRTYAEGRGSGRHADVAVARIKRAHDEHGPWPATNAVVEFFGSWSAGIEAAGFESTGVGKRRKAAA